MITFIQQSTYKNTRRKIHIIIMSQHKNNARNNIIKRKRKRNTHPTFKNTKRKIHIGLFTEEIYQSFAKRHI